MSSIITTVGGVVVITQVIPQGQTAMAMQSPVTQTASDTTSAQQATAPASTPALDSSLKVDDMTATFLQGQPHGLGVFQIFLGIMCVLFSLIAIYSEMMIVFAPFSIAAVFVLSGSLALVAGYRTSPSNVWASLLSHVLSLTVGVGGVVYISWLLASWRATMKICDMTDKDDHSVCIDRLWMVDNALNGLQSLLLIFLVGQICVATTVCVFSGKAIGCHRKSTGAPCGPMTGSLLRTDSQEALICDISHQVIENDH